MYDAERMSYNPAVNYWVTIIRNAARLLLLRLCRLMCGGGSAPPQHGLKNLGLRPELGA
jgi:hypothetical protein